MKLPAYLIETGESAREFAARAGLPHRTVLNVAERGTCTATTALAIIRASQSRPTRDGISVSLEDLVIDSDAAQGAA